MLRTVGVHGVQYIPLPKISHNTIFPYNPLYVYGVNILATFCHSTLKIFAYSLYIYNNIYYFIQGSVYKKANPRADINPESRDKFWDQQEVGVYI